MLIKLFRSKAAGFEELLQRQMESEMEEAGHTGVQLREAERKVGQLEAVFFNGVFHILAEDFAERTGKHGVAQLVQVPTEEWRFQGGVRGRRYFCVVLWT